LVWIGGVTFIETDLPGVWQIAVERREDERGYFARAFCRREFAARGFGTDYVQANVSFNVRRGTLRGLHLQLPPHAETKLVRCIRGAVFDVAVDVRPDSPRSTRWTGVELSAENGRMLLIPAGFAHGYLTLTDDTEVFYHVTEEYHPESETGLRWDDPTAAIRWPFAPTILSARDRALPDMDGLRARLSRAGHWE
jgi:dTDP-4-dehydrorhamnose 3,5-epimerase